MGPASPSRRQRLLRAVGFSLLFALPVAALAFVVRVGVPAVLDADEAAVRAATSVTLGSAGSEARPTRYIVSSQIVSVVLGGVAMVL